VANQGPDGADDAALAFVVPAGATVVGTATTTGTCAQIPGADEVVTCSFGDLGRSEGARVEITIVPPSGVTTLQALAAVGARTVDPDPCNSATVTAAVQAGA
jgi:Domain of unknown function DUF11